MFSEFALEPQLLSNWKDYRFFIGQFGVSRGRLIARYPKTWKRMVIEAAQRSGDVEFKRIEASLENIDQLLLRRQHGWDNAQEWLPNAVGEHAKRPFHGIVATKNPGGSSIVLCGNDLDPADPNPPSLWVVPTSRQIKRTATEMAQSVHFLLTQAKEILFIDPYYAPAKKTHRVPLIKFLSTTAGRDGRAMPTRIEYHTSNMDQDIATFKASLQKWVKPYLPGATTLTVVRWNQSEMHNRYILTDRGGVMFGNGLGQDDSHPTSFDTVSLLDTKTCVDLMVDYSPQSKKRTWLTDTYPVTG